MSVAERATHQRAHSMTRPEAVKALETLCWCRKPLAEHEVPCPEVPYPVAMMAYPYLRQSLLGDFWACHLMARFKIEFERHWHSQPQTRGSFFHRWAAKLLEHLEVIGQNQLRDDPECPNKLCGARPNDDLIEQDGKLILTTTGALVPGPFSEGDVCPVCGDADLEGVALEDEAVDMLAEALRQRDVPPEDRLPLPYGEHLHDLEWVVRKFAREQAFNIGHLIDVEQRVEAPVTYPNPAGGPPVTRMLSGQMDAVFYGRDASHLIVLDWKDTWAIPGPQSLSSEGYWQQRFYAWLLFHEYPDVESVTLREVYVRFGAGDDPENPENVREATITRKRVRAVERQVSLVAEAFDEAMQHGEEHPRLWENPSPGEHCNYCPLPARCTIESEVRIDGSIRDDAHAEVMAGELTVYKRAAKVREQALKGYLRRGENERAARITKDTGDPRAEDGLRVFNDQVPMESSRVPIKTAKGSKAYAFVAGTQTRAPTAAEVDEALEARARGIAVRAQDLFNTTAKSTFRLVVEKVPTDATPDERLQQAVAQAEAER